jgi:Holliday junction resolvase RusA-like endonuclease
VLVNHARPLVDEIAWLGAASATALVLLQVTIPGLAKGKARARVTRAGHAFTPAATRNAEAWVRHCIVEQVGQPMLEGPLALLVEVRLPVPVSWPKRRRADALAGLVHPTGKPDWDNLGKLVADAANGVLWRDDAQVVQATVRKLYSDAATTIVQVWRPPSATGTLPKMRRLATP